jgi:hypothetical protein
VISRAEEVDLGAFGWILGQRGGFEDRGGGFRDSVVDSGAEGWFQGHEEVVFLRSHNRERKLPLIVASPLSLSRLYS